ncbi:MAG TPA: hypothetical protein VHZ56_04085 [Devosia sp.]|jgi:hypothetical protein|nr:hypothetical protein [Devosia sp.]
MFRSACLAAALVALTAAPVFAGPSESSFLSRLVGSWSGSGNLTGAEDGPVSCRIDFHGSAGKVVYQGRCNIQDMGAQSFAGGITYDDASHRFLNRSSQGTITGIYRGGSLTFTTKAQSDRGRSYSVMTLSPSRISIDFTILDSSGDKTRAHISFSK